MMRHTVVMTTKDWRKILNDKGVILNDGGCTIILEIIDVDHEEDELLG